MKITEDIIKQLREVVDNLDGTPYGESKRTKVLTVRVYPIIHKLITTFYPNKAGRLIEGLLLEQMEKDGHIPPVLPKVTKAEPSHMLAYEASKKAEKIALEEIKERAEKLRPKKGK